MLARRLAPDVVLIAVAIVWGGSYLGAKDLAEATSVAAVLCLRFVPAALILLAVAMWRGQLRVLRTVAAPGVILGMVRAATIALETIGVTLTSATNAGLLIGLSVLITPVIESVVTRRALSVQLIASVSLGVAGVALLVGGTGLSAPSVGDLLILAAALTRAALGVAGARFATAGALVVPLTTIELTFGDRTRLGSRDRCRCRRRHAGPHGPRRRCRASCRHPVGRSRRAPVARAWHP